MSRNLLKYRLVLSLAAMLVALPAVLATHAATASTKTNDLIAGDEGDRPTEETGAARAEATQRNQVTADATAAAPESASQTTKKSKSTMMKSKRAKKSTSPASDEH
ncbi:hypothetical protein PQR02_18595 [Paraburkholderia sediminicola]|uniref:Uncharacterized protein n=1 Tax=Paraburkholderia rhynchosiae TaxID=487049 RepID=A0ACC7NDA2_9BURK